jgi:cellulose synthase/poly-beta-1,6-N-acetylglucosamine synthase-like glycosyltransferase
MEKANGDILLMTDGDVLLGRDAIESVIRQFKELPIKALTGKVIPMKGPSHFFNNLSMVGCEAWNCYRRKQSASNEFVYPTGYLYALKREIYKNIHLDESIILDDAVIGYKVREEANVHFYYSDLSKVHVLFPQNLGDFISQKVRTRAGRRQGKYKEVFLKIESEWRASLLRTNGSFLLIMVYYFLDLYCRILAQLKKKDGFIVWNPVPSTKTSAVIVHEEKESCEIDRRIAHSEGRAAMSSKMEKRHKTISRVE